MIVAMLGMLKAGGAYVPLDPNYPAERLAFMRARHGDPDPAHAKRSICRTCREYDGRVACASIAMRRMIGAPGRCRSRPAVATADALAYIIYTSGSTGEPKGRDGAASRRHPPRLSHRLHRARRRRPRRADFQSVVRCGDLRDLGRAPQWRATASCCGARSPSDPPRLAARLRADGITALFVTTALFNAIVRSVPAAFAGVKQRAVRRRGGRPALVRECLAAGAPGAAAPCLRSYRDRDVRHVASRSRPSAPGRARHCPSAGRSRTSQVGGARSSPPAGPVGVAGELYIGGEGIARGYWKRPELTVTVSSRSLRGELAGRRCIARAIWSGTSRTAASSSSAGCDQQVKLRGHRIEPAGVEIVQCCATWRRSRRRSSCCAKTGRMESGARRLRSSPRAGAQALAARDVADDAEVEAAGLHGAVGLRRSCRRCRSMPNGKIDRDALPAPIEGERRARAPRPSRRATTSSCISSRSGKTC